MRDSHAYWGEDNIPQRMRDRDELVRLRELGYKLNVYPPKDEIAVGWVNIPAELERARMWARWSGAGL